MWEFIIIFTYEGKRLKPIRLVGSIRLVHTIRPALTTSPVNANKACYHTHFPTMVQWGFKKTKHPTVNHQNHRFSIYNYHHTTTVVELKTVLKYRFQP